MTPAEIKHLRFMYDRLLRIHLESKNVDYMRAFKKIIDKNEADSCDFCACGQIKHVGFSQCEGCIEEDIT